MSKQPASGQPQDFSGVIAATLCPFRDDESIDEEGLASYCREVASVAGMAGLTCNGHTGEVMSLRPGERARVTRIVRRAVSDLSPRPRVISGVSAEGSAEAIDHAQAAKESGADAILLMPPHHWLRFDRSSSTAVGFIQDVAQGADIPVIVHQYPASTKAGYSLAEMREMVRIGGVVSIKMGTRDMARWSWDYQQLKAQAPRVSILACHDEYLLTTLLAGADGALVGFAGFVPELIVPLVQAALRGDLAAARQEERIIGPLSRIVYDFGEPGGEAHQRMKCARWLLGRFPSPRMRRPIRALSDVQQKKIRDALVALGYSCPGDGQVVRRMNLSPSNAQQVGVPPAG